MKKVEGKGAEEHKTEIVGELIYMKEEEGNE
jgi:hypothetical protein